MMKIGYLIFTLVAVLDLILAHQYIPVPGGLAWSECVYRVPSESHIINENNLSFIVHPNGTTRNIKPCLHPKIPISKLSKSFPSSSLSPSSSASVKPENGWQAYTQFYTQDETTFDQFLGYFNTPEAPATWDNNGAGIVYLFTGLQDGTGSIPTDILQPVLQYGVTEAGGSNYWAVASWYVTSDDNHVVSDLVKVQPGDSIFGNMTKTSNTTWFVGSLVVSSGQSSNIHVSKSELINQNQAYCTLEVYNLQSCKNLPASSVIFSNMTLTWKNSQPVSAQWESENDDFVCKSEAKIVSPSEVDFTFF